VLEEMGTFMALVEALRADVRSRLRVAASLTVAEHLLPGWIGALHGDAPEVALSLEVTNSTRVVQAVQTGRVDLGFVEGHEHDVPELSTLEVGRDRLAVVVRPDHPWARHASVLTAQELAGAELIVREEGSGTREVIEDALQPFGGLRTRLELGSSAALLAAARAGEGPAVLSALAAAEDLATGRLVQVAVAGLDLSRSLRAIWATRRGLGPLARRLLAAAARSAKGPPDGGAQKHTL
jgi:DNA-binding transcriptional LysR family regulator